MKVYVIRHGESESNRAKIWTGWFDAPLTEKGREDAVKVRAIISGVQFDKIYASDLSRARDTAVIAIPDCQPELSPLLREINLGSLTGKTLRIISDEEQRAEIQKNGYAMFGGESTEEFCGRIRRFRQQLEQKPYETVAIFAHGGWLRTMLDEVIGISLPHDRIHCRNCAVGIFLYEDGFWTLDSWINLP
ncbi:MAG: histidine phosphatase family protein [Ruminococcaceae bacterium]|nr:histidine phosphatase family protein [Oscillospiraceae bacterium]